MFVDDLITLFETHSDADNAFHMKAYMRNKFKFYGIKAGQRRELLKQAQVANTNELAMHFEEITKTLYSLPHREMHLCAMEIYEKQKRKKYQPGDIEFIEFLITTNSWWDTVDFIAKNILGKCLKQCQDIVDQVISEFSESGNLWLNRSTLIFQLGYKNATNSSILFNQCLKFRHSNEFFIKKAIGWALREYAKTDPKAVLNFVNSSPLKPLSHKEAIRNIL